MKKIAILGLVAVAGSSFAQVWSGAGGSIVDNSTQSSTIAVVPSLSSVSAIAVLGLTHSWAGDVTMTVTHIPSNSSFSLVTRVGYTGTGFGYSTDYNGNYVFAATGLDLWAAALAGNPASGQYAASGPNSGTPTGLFPGSWGAGSWRLDVSDAAGGDTGGWQSWEIRGTAVPEPATMAALGLGVAALIRRRRK